MSADRPLLSGVLVALVTPLDDDGRLDETSLARLIEHVVAGGVSGICPIGSTGEGPHLPQAQRLQVVGIVAREVCGRLPVIPGIAATTLVEAQEQAARYAELGATALLVAPPFYYPISQSGINTFFTELADRSPIPVLLYNIPVFTKVAITPDTVATLARHPNIIGTKDSSRDFEYFESVLAATSGVTGFRVLTGTDTLLVPTMLMGGHGTISASANLVPGWSVALYEAIKAQDWERARGLQFDVLRVVQACRRGSFPAGWKAALELAGLCRSATVKPTEPLPAESKEELRRILTEMGAIGARTKATA
jgi:4-hydroxy-tetrahydrodipicolinate synthase